MLAPTYNQQISHQLAAEISDSLDAGEHIALIGPNRCGKTLLLNLVEATRRKAPSRAPLIARVSGKQFRRSASSNLLDHLCRELGVHSEHSQSGSLDRILADVVTHCAMQTARPIWLFVQDVLDFPGPIARAVLLACQTIHETPAIRQKVAVAVTGTADFMPFTYEAVSPYHHAKKYILGGMDYDFTRQFFLSRMDVQRGILPADDWLQEVAADSDYITPKALQYLWSNLGGNPHLIQEFVASITKYPYCQRISDATAQWDLEIAKDFLEHFTLHHLPTDHYSRVALRHLETVPSFPLLLQVLRQGDGTIQHGTFQPHSLEVLGHVRRDRERTLSIAFPVWRQFLERMLTPRRIADAIAAASPKVSDWSFFGDLPNEQVDRPLTGDTNTRLERLVHQWSGALSDYASKGPEAVCRQFYAGVQHMLGFDIGGLFTIEDGVATPEYPMTCPLASPDGCVLPTADFEHAEEDNRHYWTDRSRHVVISQPRNVSRGVPINYLLYLERTGSGRIIDTSHRPHVMESIRRFWESFETSQIDYFNRKHQKTHLKVIEWVNRHACKSAFDMDVIVSETCAALVGICGYRRIIICLVDASRQTIDAVATRCRDDEIEIDFPTSVPLTGSEKERDWDVQRWVVTKNRTCVIPNASSPAQHSPRTQQECCQRVCMRAIAVVPMTIEDRVIGTIHFENEDKVVPSQAIRQLMEVLAQQLAALFYSATRITLLQESLQQLDDEIVIVDPRRDAMFINTKAAKGPCKPGWQNPPQRLEVALGSDHRAGQLRTSIAELESSGDLTSRRYQISDAEPVIAMDYAVTQVDDFRRKLQSPFSEPKAPVIGFVERTHDLSGVYSLFHSLRAWLAAEGLEETGMEILAYFKAQGYSWCRIFLMRQSNQGAEFLQSFLEYGLDNAEDASRFKDGGLKFTEADSESWHVLTFTEPVMYEFNPNTDGPRVYPGAAADGMPHFYARPVRQDSWLPKGSSKWIEAPLRIGHRLVGKIVLSREHDILPERRELLRAVVTSVAAALSDASWAEESARSARAEAQKLAAAKAVHQLTNTLNPARTWLHDTVEALESHQIDGNVVQVAQKAKRAVDRTMAILGSYLQYAIDTPFVMVNNVPIASLIAIFEDAAATSTIAQMRVIPNNIQDVIIRINEEAIHQVAEILVRNAIEHSGNSVDSLRLTLETTLVNMNDNTLNCVGKYLRIALADNGIGVRLENKLGIFAPFQTTRPKGTGLGLNIADELVRRHSGHMKEEGTYGDGALFVLYLPLKHRAKE